jgi:hypothetical protein
LYFKALGVRCARRKYSPDFQKIRGGETQVYNCRGVTKTWHLAAIGIGKMEALLRPFFVDAIKPKSPAAIMNKPRRISGMDMELIAGCTEREIPFGERRINELDASARSESRSQINPSLTNDSVTLHQDAYASDVRLGLEYFDTLLLSMRIGPSDLPMDLAANCNASFEQEEDYQFNDLSDYEMLQNDNENAFAVGEPYKLKILL